HDRHLLRTVCDQFMLVANGVIQNYDGDLEDYAQWLADHRRRPAASKTDSQINHSYNRGEESTNHKLVIDKRQQRQQSADARKKLKPLRDRIKRCEKTLSDFQNEQANIEHKMTHSDLYLPENKGELTDLLEKQAELKKSLNLAEEEWMDAAEELDQLEIKT
ncbi:MAG: ABC transporter ATP-binding protein, partial [Gammaproteobacteria bacterium]|nr:ABC transporter ATP-binding protein [Gammaproteobacteria bacterium]